MLRTLLIKTKILVLEDNLSRIATVEKVIYFLKIFSNFMCFYENSKTWGRNLQGTLVTKYTMHILHKYNSNQKHLNDVVLA